MLIALCAVICGADGFSSIQAFGEAKADWLNRFLELKHGIPSHDTFGDVFARIDPEEFGRCFLGWVRSAREATEGEVVAIDGKKLRRSYDAASDKAALHMVQAWASKQRLTLGQVSTEGKSNEITAIPELLEVLDVAGCLVTIDAMGCQKEIAEAITDKEADENLSRRKSTQRPWRSPSRGADGSMNTSKRLKPPAAPSIWYGLGQSCGGHVELLAQAVEAFYGQPVFLEQADQVVKALRFEVDRVVGVTPRAWGRARRVRRHIRLTARRRHRSGAVNCQRDAATWLVT